MVLVEESITPKESFFYLFLETFGWIHQREPTNRTKARMVNAALAYFALISPYISNYEIAAQPYLTLLRFHSSNQLTSALIYTSTLLRFSPLFCFVGKVFCNISPGCKIHCSPLAVVVGLKLVISLQSLNSTRILHHARVP